MLAPAHMHSAGKVVASSGLAHLFPQDTHEEGSGAGLPADTSSESETSMESEHSVDIEKSRDMPFYYEMKIKDYDSALLIACYTGDTYSVKKLIEKFQALPTCRDEKDFPCGFHAAMSGNLECLKVILDHDAHEMYDEYFEYYVTVDNMTPLMTLLRHGYLEIVNFFLHQRNCKLRLLGPRFGVDREALVKPGKMGNSDMGLTAPLRKWLELAPEVGHVSHISRRRPLELPHRKVTLIHDISEEEFEYLQCQRDMVRMFVRAYAAEYEDEKIIRPPSRSIDRRNALITYDVDALDEEMQWQKKVMEAESQVGRKSSNYEEEEIEAFRPQVVQAMVISTGTPVEEPIFEPPGMTLEQMVSGRKSRHTQGADSSRKSQSAPPPRSTSAVSPQNTTRSASAGGARPTLNSSSSRSHHSLNHSTSQSHLSHASSRGQLNDRKSMSSRTSTMGLRNNPTIWRCGMCGHYHDEVDIEQVESYECDACARENVYNKPKKVEHVRETEIAEMSANRNSAWGFKHRLWDEDNYEGELWENIGSEFVSEEDVHDFLTVFKRSSMWSLGPRRLRELLRVCRVLHLHQNDTVFMEGQPIGGLYCLKVGGVSLDCKANPGDSEWLWIDENSFADDKSHPGVKVLDSRAFMDSQSLHKTTARIKSAEAVVFAMYIDDIMEFCGDTDIANIIHDSLSVSIVHMVPVIRLAFTPKELQMVAHQLSYREYRQDQVLCRKGERLGHILIVQRGKLLVDEGGQEVVINIGGDAPAGGAWLPYFIVGVRPLLFDLTSTCYVQVKGALAETWVLNIQDVDKALKGKKLLPLLQMATYILYLQRLPMFKNLKDNDTRLKLMISHSQTSEYWKTEIIIKQGDIGDSLYILVEGTVSIIKNGKQAATLVADIDNDKVHFFGEVALIQSTPRGATVKVKSNVATTLCVQKDVIEEAFGSVEALLEEQGLTKAAVLDMQQKQAVRRGKSATSAAAR